VNKTLSKGLLLVLTYVLGTASGQELRRAPDLAYTVPGQGEKTLGQYRGKVIAIEFILTTCPHCQAASRLMTALQQEYGSRGFQALDLAINALDEKRTPDQANALVAAFASNFHVGFPVGWVSRDRFLSFLGISIAEYTVVPQLVMIDRKGYIRYQTPPRGDSTSLQEATIRQRVEELLAPEHQAEHRVRHEVNR
jgi:thiol-disulfide isomerase/thioredoxin